MRLACGSSDALTTIAVLRREVCGGYIFQGKKKSRMPLFR